MVSATELVEAWKARARSHPVLRSLRVTPNGVLLGAGTVIIPSDGEGELSSSERKERVLALLSIAYGRAVPSSVLENIRRAQREFSEGNACLAAIHIARAQLPALPSGDVAPFRLFAAERLLNAGLSPRRLLESCDIDITALHALKAGFKPDQPRVPAGNGRESGEWTDADAETLPVAAQVTARGGKDPFFDTLYGPVRAATRRLGIDESWLLGLAAHEGGWLSPHNREINNPFGGTHAGGRDVHYSSIDEAVAAWERRYGPVVYNI